MSGQKVRIPVYVSAEMLEEIKSAVSASGLERQDWFRDVLTAALSQTENGTGSASTEREVLRLEAHLADLKAQLSDQKESSKHLEILLAKEQDMVLTLTHRTALPAAGGSSWWKFWLKRREAPDDIVSGTLHVEPR